MGELFINGRPLNGERFEYCDDCQNLKPVEGGYSVSSGGELVMWICQACRLPK
jgi:hypothetical protein